MLVKWVWHDFILSLYRESVFGGYFYSDIEIALLLIIVLIITPIVLLLDIIILPLEILYWLLLKFVRKLRRGYDNG